MKKKEIDCRTCKHCEKRKDEGFRGWWHCAMWNVTSMHFYPIVDGCKDYDDKREQTLF